MLCMLISRLLGGCFKSMIKWSNVCSWNLKFMRQKNKGKWYLVSIYVKCLGNIQLLYFIMILKSFEYQYYWYDIFW